MMLGACWGDESGGLEWVVIEGEARRGSLDSWPGCSWDWVVIEGVECACCRGREKRRL